MTKKAEAVNATAPVLVSPEGTDLASFGLAVNSNAPTTKTEERMWQEKRKQQLAIEHQKDKTNQAFRCLGEMQNHASNVFYQTMNHHDAINDAARGKAFQPLIEEFHDHLAKLQAQHTLRVLDAGAYNVGALVAQTTYLPDVQEEEPRRGWRKLLVG